MFKRAISLGSLATILMAATFNVAMADLVPSSPYTGDGVTLRSLSVDNGQVVISGGTTISLVPNAAPNAAPGAASQPLPKFSGLNAPYWLNQYGPAQVADDLVVHGLNDNRMGLVNTSAPGGVPQPVTIYDGLSVSSASQFSNDLNVLGSLRPAFLNVSGTATLNGAAILKGNVEVGKVTQIGAGSFDVYSPSTLYAPLVVNGDVVVGNPTAKKNITVNGNVEITGGISAIERAIFADGIDALGEVNATSLVSSTLRVGQNATVTGTLTTGAAVTLSGSNAPFTVGAVAPGVQKPTVLNGTLTASGATTLNNTLNVAGLTTVAAITASGAATLNGGLKVTGVSTTNGNVYVGVPPDPIAGTPAVPRNLYVMGETQILGQNNIIRNNLQVDGNVSIGGSTTINGSITSVLPGITVQKNLAVNGTLSSGTSIGSFNVVNSGNVSAPADLNWSAKATAACAGNDKIVACDTNFGVAGQVGNLIYTTPPTNSSAWFSQIQNGTCTVRVRRTALGAANDITAGASALCFSPN